MPDQELKELLQKLHDELESTSEMEAETLALVRTLETDIHKLMGSSARKQTFEGVLDSARSLKNRFAVNHPTAERFMAEIMETLTRLGI